LIVAMVKQIQPTPAQKLRAANQQINTLLQQKRAVMRVENAGPKAKAKGSGGGYGKGPQMRPAAKLVKKKSLFNAFAPEASRAVPTALSSGVSVNQRYRYCAIKRMGKLEPVEEGSKTYHGGRNALIFHPYNNVALYQTDDGGTSTVGGTEATHDHCPLGHFGLFQRLSDTSPPDTGEYPQQVANLNMNIPKEIQIQRFSIRIRNITCLRDLDGGVYVLRLPSLSTLYKTWVAASTISGAYDYMVGCHGEVGPSSGVAASGGAPESATQDIPASFLKQYVRTHTETRFYTAAELVSAKQINVHVNDAMAYETWGQLINAVKDTNYDTPAAVVGAALKDALSLSHSEALLNVADDAGSNIGVEHPGFWRDGGWMASATGTVAKFGVGGAGGVDGPMRATMTPSGMGVVVMIFENTRMQEYEVTCQMTAKCRYSSSNILSQQQVQQPTAPVAALNAFRDIEENKGSTIILWSLKQRARSHARVLDKTSRTLLRVIWAGRWSL
jgi:hypothetical protein